MNQVVTTDPNLERAVETGRAVGLSAGHGTKLAPESLGDVVRFAEIMSKAGLALPVHLREQPGACMAVAMQALEWNMSPFAVASKSYAVNGVIAYEAQLIAAVVNSRSGIQGRLKYCYEGEGNELKCYVTGVIDGDELVYESPRKADIKPQNSPLWKTDEKQQLGYYSARAWARRYTPEVLLGVYDREEAQTFQGPDNAVDVTPKVPLSQRLSEAKAADTGEGFDPAHVEAETAAYTEIIEEPEQDIGAEAEQTSAEADTPVEERLPSDASTGAPDDDEQDFDAGLEEAPTEDEASKPVSERYREELKGCADEAAVEKVTSDFRVEVNSSSKEQKQACRKAKAERLQLIAEGKADG